MLILSLGRKGKRRESTYGCTHEHETWGEREHEKILNESMYMYVPEQCRLLLALEYILHVGRVYCIFCVYILKREKRRERE